MLWRLLCTATTHSLVWYYSFMNERPPQKNLLENKESRQELIQFLSKTSRELGFTESPDLEVLHKKILSSSNKQEAFSAWVDTVQRLEIFKEKDPIIYGKSQLGFNLMQLSIYLELQIEKDFTEEIRMIAEEADIYGSKEIGDKVISILRL